MSKKIVHTCYGCPYYYRLNSDGEPMKNVSKSPNDLRAAGLVYNHTGTPIVKVKNVDLENGIIEIRREDI